MFVQPGNQLLRSCKVTCKHLINPVNLEFAQRPCLHSFCKPALFPFEKALPLVPSAPVISDRKLGNPGHRRSVSGLKKHCL